MIDVHAHYMDPRYLGFMAKFGVVGLMPQRPAPGTIGYAPPPAPPSAQATRPMFGPENLEERFAAMKAAGVTRQILSPTNAPYLESKDDGVQAARLINDIHKELSDAHPDQFSFYVAMPLPHVQETLEELKRGFDMGAVGATMHTFCLNETVARDEFEPIWEELNKRKAVLFYHPCQNGLCSHLVNDFGLTVCAGASFEDAVLAMHLIAKQIPVRYPDIKFIVPHFGGPLAMLANRLDGQMNQQGFSEKPSETVRRMYYDTVGWGSKGALLAAVATYGESQIVTGSDWPFLLHYESYTQTFENLKEAGLPDATVDRILNRNTQALFGLER
jgi:6-methylsalicylate decarboxylase